MQKAISVSLPPGRKAVRLALESPRRGTDSLPGPGVSLIPGAHSRRTRSCFAGRNQAPDSGGRGGVEHRYITAQPFRTGSMPPGTFFRLVYGNRLGHRPRDLERLATSTDNDRRSLPGGGRVMTGVQRAYKRGSEERPAVITSQCSPRCTPAYPAGGAVAPGRTGPSTVPSERTGPAALPRFGLRRYQEAQNARYFGFGPYERYVDKRRASFLGLFETTASENHEDYLRPQENGSHFGCAWAEVTGNDGFGLRLASDGDFSFQLSPYTQEELTEKAHNYELQKAPGPVLCADFKQNGIGSNSCGPALLEKYAFQEREFSFGLRLIPLA